MAEWLLTFCLSCRRLTEQSIIREDWANIIFISLSLIWSYKINPKKSFCCWPWLLLSMLHASMWKYLPLWMNCLVLFVLICLIPFRMLITLIVSPLLILDELDLTNNLEDQPMNWVLERIEFCLVFWWDHFLILRILLNWQFECWIWY